MTFPVIYIAGPYTAKTRWDQEHNVRAAELAAFQIAGAGAVPVCPHTMYRHFDGTYDAETWYAYTLELVRRCDAVFLLPLWKDSAGACREKGLAEELNMPVFDRLAEVGRWIERRHRGEA